TVPKPPGEPYPIDRVLEEIRRRRPKLVFLCSPNNPTGEEIELAHVREICSAAEGLVLFDEAYAEFTDQTAVDLLPVCRNLIVSRTFSKAFSFAGLRFGYFIADANIIAELRKVNLPYNINLFTEAAALRLLDSEKEMLQRIDFILQERERLYQELRRFKQLLVYPSKANFLLLKPQINLNLFRALKERGVLVRDVGSYPLLSGCVRVTVGLREENDLFLSVLESILEE
ncbi:MAG: aminotransferase class I/II-fold pyridoxal phosphate-dependent enzyme, partial [candidate division KSB1 bacterium]|nr:aminotransferase class I/II-fold pyridoxal phosphate-dependent enzyme [candidate division KSB1 bacterium]